MDYLNYEVFELATLRQVLIIVHLIGLAIGTGAALFSDFLFTHILKDKKIDKTEYGILKLASKVVWLGLAVMLASGLLIFAGDTERLLDSSKFLAKMTILSALIVNGLFFHFVQIPGLKKYINKDLSKNKAFLSTKANPLFVGGAISGVSWIAALVLGSLSSLDLSYIQIMSVYLAVVAVAVLVSLKLKKVMLG